MTAPTIISRCVGLHIVTSMPYARCHSSSIGNPDIAHRPMSPIASAEYGTRMPITGMRRPTFAFVADAKNSPMKAEPKIVTRPTTIAVCGAVKSASSRPRLTCQRTSL